VTRAGSGEYTKTVKNIDWVAALSSCQLSTVFETLRMQIQEDVKARKEQLQGQADYSYTYIGNGSSFAVAAAGNRISGKIVKFALADNAIVVADADDKVLFQATLTLNDDGECRLLIDGQEREFWQFRKRALEGLLFRNPRL